MQEIHTKHSYTHTQVSGHRLREVSSLHPSSPRPLASTSSHPPLLFLWSCHLFSSSWTVPYLLCLVKIQAPCLIHLRDHSLIGYLFLSWMECFLPSAWSIQTTSFIYDCGCFLRWCLVLDLFRFISVPAQEGVVHKNREHALFLGGLPMACTLKKVSHIWHELKYLYEHLMPITIQGLKNFLSPSWAVGFWAPLDDQMTIARQRGTSWSSESASWDRQW